MPGVVLFLSECCCTEQVGFDVLIKDISGFDFNHRPQTKRCQDSNLKRLVGRREPFLCAMDERMKWCQSHERRVRVTTDLP